MSNFTQMDVLNATEDSSPCIRHQSSHPALPRSFLIALLLFCLVPMLHGLAIVLSSRSRRNLSITLRHNEESSVASSRSIGMELGSEGSILSTCTNMTDISMCANLKCMLYNLTVRYIAPCRQCVLRVA